MEQTDRDIREPVASDPCEPGIRAGQSMGSDRTVLLVHVGDSIAEVERRLILATLEQLSGDKRRAAEVLGISLKTLYNRLSVYAAAVSGRPGRATLRDASPPTG
jgi:DNA-binding NtrC family response regulator